MKLKLSKNKIERLLKLKHQTKKKFKNKELQRVSSFRKKRAYNLRNKTIKPLHKKYVNKKSKIFDKRHYIKNKNPQQIQDKKNDRSN